MKQISSKSVRWLGLALLLVEIACHKGPPHYGVAPASEGKYPAGEAAAVYRAVLGELYLSTGESPPRVVLWDSAAIRAEECMRRPCTRIPQYHSAISDETIRDFERASLLTAPMRADFGFGLPVELLSETNRYALDSIGRPISDSLQKVNRYSEAMPFWLGFRRRYPGAWGYTVFTRVGFDAKRRQALLQVRHQCGSGCSQMEVVFLEKTGANWKVAERMPVEGRSSDWVDIVQRIGSPVWDGRDSVVLGSLRYLGSDARYLKLLRRGQDSIRMLIRDSIARDLLPRRITGTIRSRITGMPIAFAEIIAHVQPNDTKIRIVSDSAGRYSFLGLPIGGTMLEVQCPGSNGSTGRTLDAPGLYLHPAIDTVINSTVPDIAPCWKGKWLHRLTSGWFESKEAMTASTPNADEREVYKTAIDVIDASARHVKPAGIFSHTIPPCEGSERCGGVQLARLEREGLIDAYVFRDFNAKTEKKVALNPAFPQTLALRVVTPQEIAYYADEAAPQRDRHDVAMDTALLISAFRTLNGTGKGILSLSRIGFNEAHSLALLEARLDTALGSWGPSTMMLLRKTGSSWRVMINDVGKDTTSGEWSGARCLPVKARGGLTRQAVAGLTGTFGVSLVETVGRMGEGTVRMRLSYAFPDRSIYGKPIPPETRARSKPQHVFEIIDNKTGKVDDRASLDFWIKGAGVDIGRKSGLMQLDGFSYWLNILRVTPTGFFGSWEAGVFGFTEFGYFCARRVP
jgi:hypothetical protein